jgi:ABC-type polysaccharide/polyol phosphate transport system ATPase subunit
LIMGPIDVSAGQTDSAELRRELAEIDRRLSDLRKQLDDAEQWEGHLLGAIHATRVERKRLEKAIDAAGRHGPQGASEASAEDSQPAGGLTAIEVRNLSKSFRVPIHQPDTLKEQVLHPFRSQRYEPLRALDRVSLEVGKGEFLGVAGPNGSGKSTLLKIIAGIYAADEGTVMAEGQVAPFIELGAGMNEEMTAFDNVVISGVLMGLEPEVARARFDDVIAFAGLTEFTEMKLKNYSSGMRVRLGFSVMAQVDADILLVDEVLAVGDAEFRRRCLNRLHELRGVGTTIVLVTHAMEPMVEHCDRAILLEKGRVVLDGDPGEIAERVTTTVPDPG